MRCYGDLLRRVVSYVENFLRKEAKELKARDKKIMEQWENITAMDNDMEAKFRMDWLKDNQDGICMHCGKPAGGIQRVCDTCYNLYTPSMLADLEG